MVHHHHCFLGDCSQSLWLFPPLPRFTLTFLENILPSEGSSKFHPSLDQQFPKLVVFLHCCVYGWLEPSLFTHFLKFKTCRGGLCECPWGLFSASLCWMSWAHKRLFPTVWSSSCSCPSRPTGRDKIKWENLWSLCPQKCLSLLRFLPLSIPAVHLLLFVCCHNKTPQTVWLQQLILMFSPFWRLEVQDHIGSVGFCWSLSSACTWPPSPCLYMVFPICVHMSVS